MLTRIPRMMKVCQTFENEQIRDIEQVTRDQIQSLDIRLKPGARVAIAVGSRGIANLQRIVKVTVETIRALGGNPFIIPAMGSHGGAVAEGQKQVLEGYGVTEAYTGAEIMSSMDVVTLPSGDLGHKIYMDRCAYEADATVVINRVKVHTDFHGTTESGLLKMCVIGIGKHAMALEMHRYGVHGLKEMVPAAARHILQCANIIMGIGIVENAYDQTAVIRAVRPENMEREEIQLLSYNRAHMPSLPTAKLDVLVVDQLGKDISGVGMDPNITGRMRIRGQAEPAHPDIANIIALDLTEASHGNALGMGLADFITRRFFNRINFAATYENVITSTFTERGKMPIVADTARQAMVYALRTAGVIENSEARIIRIQNTLRLDELYVSPAVFRELDLPAMGDWQDMFDDKGDVTAFDEETT